MYRVRINATATETYFSEMVCFLYAIYHFYNDYGAYVGKRSPCYLARVPLDPIALYKRRIINRVMDDSPIVLSHSTIVGTIVQQSSPIVFADTCNLPYPMA